MSEKDKKIYAVKPTERSNDMAARSPSAEKLSEALKLLDEAAMEKKDEIRNLIDDKYQNLKNTLSSVEPRVRENWNELSETAQEMGRIAKARTQKAATELDKDVHDRPWAYIGGAAFASLILGFILGRK